MYNIHRAGREGGDRSGEHGMFNGGGTNPEKYSSCSI